MDYFLRDYDSESEEKLQLQRELKWLISEELPDILNSIHLVAGGFLQSSFWGDHPVGNGGAHNKYGLYNDENSNIKGSVLLQNGFVNLMELIAQMHVFNHKHLFRLTLGERSYPLKQIIMGKSILLKIRQLTKNSNFISPDDTFQLLQKLVTLLSNCSSILLNGSPQDLFPNKICDSKAFEPNLPEDLILQLSLNNGLIAIDLINIAVASQYSGVHRSFSSSLLKKAPNSSQPIYQYGYRDVQIVDHLTVSAQCQEVRDVIDSSLAALTRLNTFIQNLQVIS
ncbi:hypothetical protein DSO57_1005798 [Entomophthora muscae]|uniref:Uncharacterized protein n=1 Tax=Entomophthora muscae TaxID=34485 RepID=A0ACC2TIU5_9FUNG|nr:hypothetical protein DSO57_1005798 [Entomophthora muscae]